MQIKQIPYSGKCKKIKTLRQKRAIKSYFRNVNNFLSYLQILSMDENNEQIISGKRIC